MLYLQTRQRARDWPKPASSFFANAFDRSWPVSSCQTDLSTDPEY